MKNYRCLYNHELLILFTAQSPYQTYETDVSEENVRGFVRELKGTQVDALLACPTAWKMPLYHSKFDPRWEAPPLGREADPLPESDSLFGDKVFHRVRRAMEKGLDPVGLTLKTCREIGLDFFISYRMNELHYNHFPDYPTHSPFWKKHWKTHGLPSRHLDYKHEIVREHYLDLLFEMIDLYELDGLELDFCRFPKFFRDEEVEAGIPLMNDFVGKVRKKLDETGKARGKNLPLCVRVLRSPSAARALGLDVAAWDREGLVQMVNVSPFAQITPDIDIEGFKDISKKAKVYGEMNYFTTTGETPWGFHHGTWRHANAFQYETIALDLLDRGADGLSFFNFAYVRDHVFSDPRMAHYPGAEPPYEILKTILDEKHLRSRPKHYPVHGYVWPGITGECSLGIPATLNPHEENIVRLHIADRFEKGHPFQSALLRLEGEKDIVGQKLIVRINGKELHSTHGQGELFPPITALCLPRYENLLFYEVPLDCLRHGINEISLMNLRIRHGHYPHPYVKIKALELAIYPWKIA